MLGGYGRGVVEVVHVRTDGEVNCLSVATDGPVDTDGPLNMLSKPVRKGALSQRSVAYWNFVIMVFPQFFKFSIAPYVDPVETRTCSATGTCKNAFKRPFRTEDALFFPFWPSFMGISSRFRPL